METDGIKLLRKAYNVLKSCELSNYGKDWAWPDTAHETAMNEVKDCLTDIENYLPPVTPGEILLTEFISPLGISYLQLVRDLKLSSDIITKIIIDGFPITADICLKFGKYFGTSEGYWLRLQNRYDLEIARRTLKKELDEIKPFSKENN
jgi:addiction module HigA family antidote